MTFWQPVAGLAILSYKNGKTHRLESCTRVKVCEKEWMNAGRVDGPREDLHVMGLGTYLHTT